MILDLPHWLIAILAIATGILGVARLTRIIVFDDYPPAVWWRVKWTDWTENAPGAGPYRKMWVKMFTCWWCLSPWIALVCILWWMFLVPLHPAWLYAWWAWWGMLAAGYVATMVIVRDTPPEQE